MDNIEIARSSSNEIKNGPKFEDRDKESVDNFQKFFYDLFEKNGILNDLRAYLRRHIVDVLKNSNAGDTSMCQKHFTQRLELKTQALNILVAEYLLHSGLNYTLSVFVSEIPLANMVFEFASSLMKGDGENNLRFKDKDVWSIIQHLGIKCDSKLVINVMEMYKNEKQALLLCIIKSLHSPAIENTCVEQVTSSEDALSEHSSTTLSEKTSKKFAKFSSKCQHYALCKGCHYKLMRLKDKYKKRKDADKTKESSLMSMTINSLMKNMSNIEGNLVNEMFDQLKSVYESELEMMRSKQERRVQQTLKEHAHSMLQQRQEMEEAFKAREQDLERGVRAKKKFLWGLARTLRAQHEQLARAMLAVKYHTQRLRVKEEDLKAQLSEVEHLMQTRGEDMQAQISSELVYLQRQLDLVKRERETVNREKAELEHLRHDISSNHANIDIDEIEAVSDTAWTNFDMLKTELSMLREYNDSPQDDKCVTDKSTVTEENGSTEVLNNEQDIKPVREEDRLKNSQLVNDFKKQKIVNFTMRNADEMFAERHCPMEEPHRPHDNALAQLAHENERLREYARQQEQQVAQLGSRAAQLQAELSEARAHRPQPPAPPSRPSPPTQTDTPCIDNSANEPAPTVTSQLGWRCCGGGEETTLLKCVQPRVFVPGDTVPFIGLLHERHNEPKRLMNQWRSARRASPLRARPASPRAAAAASSAPAPPAAIGQTRDVTDKTYQDQSPSFPRKENQTHSNTLAENLAPDSGSPTQPFNQPSITHAPPTTPLQGGAGGAGGAGVAAPRARSPKSVLREAKEKLRAYPNNKYFGISPETTSRDKSPTTVLREAKLRLRKLEIEAEAVEKSYMDYRKRQTVLKNDKEYTAPAREEAIVTKDVDGQSPKIPNQKPETQNSIKSGVKSFLQEYRRNLHLSDTHSANNIATARTKPIPEAFSPAHGKGGRGNTATENYLEHPMTEFQKFYKTSESFNKPKNTEQQDLDKNKHRPVRSFPPSPPGCPPRRDHPSTGDSLANEVKQLEAKKEALNKAKNSKKVELEILKRNITQMYHYEEKNKEEKVTQDGNHQAGLPAVLPEERDRNLLRIEVENVNESNEMKVEAQAKDVLVVVQSTVDNAMSDVDESKKLRGNMTILISPKRSDTNKPRAPHPRSASPEQAANLTRNDVLEAIYQADPVKVTSNDEVCDATFKGEDSEGDGNYVDDYPDDFSADVDNYDYSRTDSRSPLSAAQSPDEIWDDSQTFP